MAVSIHPTMTVGQLVAERPNRSRVFEAVHIDYCCGGKLPLEEACRRRGLATEDVISLLNAIDEASADNARDDIDPGSLTLRELADHIEQTHHAYLRAELPRLEAIVDKVTSVHGASEPRLATVRKAFKALQQELVSHMAKEEQILFPMVRELQAAARAPRFHCGSIANPIRQMEAEHDSAGDALDVMRRATDGFRPPDWACNTYRAMLDGLARLEKDMHQHVHKENNLLFPKAIAREREFQTGAPA